MQTHAPAQKVDLEQSSGTAQRCPLRHKGACALAEMTAMLCSARLAASRLTAGWAAVVLARLEMDVRAALCSVDRPAVPARLCRCETQEVHEP